MDNHLPISVNKLDVAELKTGSHQAVQLQVGESKSSVQVSTGRDKGTGNQDKSIL